MASVEDCLKININLFKQVVFSRFDQHCPAVHNFKSFQWIKTTNFWISMMARQIYICHFDAFNRYTVLWPSRFWPDVISFWTFCWEQTLFFSKHIATNVSSVTAPRRVTENEGINTPYNHNTSIFWLVVSSWAIKSGYRCENLIKRQKKNILASLLYCHLVPNERYRKSCKA